MKLRIKRALIHCGSTLGRTLRFPSHRRWLCDTLVPYLLDERVLKRGLSERPLLGIPIPILCDPYVYVHRMPYWCGRLYETGLESFLRQHLKEGDTFIDVGCNVGQIAVLAACLVGPVGRVYAFDANSEVARTAECHCRKHELANTRVFPFGLGRTSGHHVLHTDSSNTGLGTLRDSEHRATTGCMKPSGKRECEVRVGDDVLSGANMTGAVVLKVDVEGYEFEVLKGLSGMLDEHIQSAIVEITPEWIGGSEGVARICHLMETHGLDMFELGRDGICAKPIGPGQIVRQTNVVFHSSSGFSAPLP